jgi:hypothetical protein
MLDVHPPHGKMHGAGDFFLHLFTITVGLLIALALEGCVERQHQRHLVHEAEAGMRREIEENSKQIGSLRQQVVDENNQLNTDLAVLDELKIHPKEQHKELSFTFRMRGFDDVTWKTAQTTGALALMPYGDAEVYSGIYDTQMALEGQQKEIVDDVMRAASLVITKKEGEQPTAEEISLIRERIGLVQLRLLLLNSFIDGLEKTYKKFEGEHAGA